MKKKTVLALALALAVTTAASSSLSFVSTAKELTQATKPSEVTYGCLTKQQIAIIAAHFDATYYASQNPDLVEVVGNNQEALFQHFVNCGIYEGRTENGEFNPAAYASAYEDLNNAFGFDIVKYYEHYYNLGVNEGRDITTIEECKQMQIKLMSFFQDEEFTSAYVYAASTLMGTSNYSAINDAVSYAVKNGSAVVKTDEGTYVIKKDEPKTEDTKNADAKKEDTKKEDTKKEEPKQEQPVVEEPTKDEPVVEPVIEEPVVEEPTVEEPAKEDPKQESTITELGTLSLSKDSETCIIVYKIDDEVSFDYSNNLRAYTNREGHDDDILGYIPMTITTTEAGNASITDGNYDIAVFEADGIIIGTEGTLKDTEQKNTYLPSDEVSGPYAKRMTNFEDGEYKENATAAIDVNGDENTVYTVSASGETTENGDEVTTYITNNDNKFNFKVKYTFNKKEDAEKTEASDSKNETKEEVKAEAKTDSKDETKAEAKSEVKADTTANTETEADSTEE